MPTEWNDINAFDTITCLTGLSDIAVSSTMTYSVSLTARYIAVVSSMPLLDLCEVELYTDADYDSTPESACTGYDSTTLSQSEIFILGYYGLFLVSTVMVEAACIIGRVT